MPWRPQPASLVYAPPSYPSPTYRGPGEITAVRLAGKTVGHLFRQGDDRLGYLPAADLDEDGHTLRLMVYDILREYAREGQPRDEAWAKVLRHVPHGDPVVGPLDAFRAVEND
ncbi:hypothetical protein [Micromonospora sp. IBHARD004]|uniref:hypothetical protein n=1 Tax=Micromonospora sp. IBHARD004 TaxID=3457764 RepID=UPI00405A218D